MSFACQEPTSFTPRTTCIWLPWLKRPFQTVVSTPVLSWVFIPTTPRNTWLNSGGRPQKRFLYPVCSVFSFKSDSHIVVEAQRCSERRWQVMSVRKKALKEEDTNPAGGNGLYAVYVQMHRSAISPRSHPSLIILYLLCDISSKKNVIFKACRAEDPTFREASPKMRSLFISCQCVKKCVWCFKV